jgi:hypothetical protein
MKDLIISCFTREYLFGKSKCTLIIKDSITYTLFATISVFFYINAQAGAIESHARLPKLQIKVCVTDESFISSLNSNLSMKALAWGNIILPNQTVLNGVEQLITREFNSKTPIQFYGWKLCDQVGADVYLVFFENRAAGLATFGLGYEHTPPPSETLTRKYSNGYVFIGLAPERNSLSFEENLGFRILHEFGHIVGLRHEGSRPEADLDKNCRGSLRRREKFSSSVRMLPYDPHSIMNYCFKNNLERAFSDSDLAEFRRLGPTLSKGDLATIRLVYPVSSGQSKGLFYNQNHY